MKNSRRPFHLPDEIIEEILLNLPVQPLLKFRCVCKSWCCLISSEKFIESHLQIYGKNAGQKIIFKDRVRPQAISHFPLYSLIPGDVVEYDDFVSPVEKNADIFAEHLILKDYVYTPAISRCHSSIKKAGIHVGSVNIVGCCNGLICISIYYSGSGPDLRLWNPSTRKSKILLICLFGLSGFGFDELSKDYKVVFQQFGVPFGSQSRTQVYSLKSNSWKLADVSGNIDYHPDPDKSGIFANGKLHWLMGGSRVVCFDLTKEVWETVEFDTPLDSSLRLGVLGGCLCIQCNFPEDRQDVWILKHQTWNKVFTIKHHSRSTSDGTTLMLCVGPIDTILVMEMKREKHKIKIHGMEINSDQHDGNGISFAALELQLVQIHHESLVQLPVAKPRIDY